MRSIFFLRAFEPLWLTIFHSEAEKNFLFFQTGPVYQHQSLLQIPVWEKDRQFCFCKFSVNFAKVKGKLLS